MRRSLVTHEKIVILGSGWAGFSLMNGFKANPLQYELVCVSVNNHFLFTPLLTTTTVGTLEFRGITEPTMSCKKLSRFIHAEAIAVDASRKVVRCRSVYDVAKSEESLERYFPEFDVPFDKLVKKQRAHVLFHVCLFLIRLFLAGLEQLRLGFLA
jgi:NADH dehydrogenase FAD-containing subunit